jgi:hypothetical protein
MNQGDPGKKAQPDSMESRCLNRVNEFLKWYPEFSMKDDGVRHVLKHVSKQVLRIDTLGAIMEVERYYQSGFLTQTWKVRAIKDVLAADATLAQLKTDDEAYMEDRVPFGVIGDPVLGLGYHEGWFEGKDYKWEVNGFKKLKEGIFSVNLFLHDENDQVNKWILHLVIVDGQLKISWVSDIMRQN